MSNTTKLPFGLVAHEFADKLPLMEGNARKVTLESIQRDGIKKPVVLYKGKVADGRNRLILGNEAGIDKESIPFREFGSDPSDGDDLLAFVLRENLARRNLTEGHLGLLAASISKEIVAKLKANVSEEAKPDKGKGNGTTIPETPQKRASHVAREEAAKVTGTSVDNVKKSQLIAQYPELAAKVESKEISLNAAYEEARRIRDADKAGKDSSKRKAERAEALVAIAKDLGEDSGILTAIKRGSILAGPEKHKELLIFTELPKAEKIKLAPLIIQKMPIKDAIRISSSEPSADSTITDAINFAIVNGVGAKKASYEFKIGKGESSWSITITPGKETVSKLKK